MSNRFSISTYLQIKIGTFPEDTLLSNVNIGFNRELTCQKLMADNFMVLLVLGYISL